MKYLKAIWSWIVERLKGPWIEIEIDYFPMTYDDNPKPIVTTTNQIELIQYKQYTKQVIDLLGTTWNDAYLKLMYYPIARPKSLLYAHIFNCYMNDVPYEVCTYQLKNKLPMVTHN